MVRCGEVYIGHCSICLEYYTFSKRHLGIFYQEFFLNCLCKALSINSAMVAENYKVIFLDSTIFSSPLSGSCNMNYCESLAIVDTYAQAWSLKMKVFRGNYDCKGH